MGAGNAWSPLGPGPAETAAAGYFRGRRGHRGKRTKCGSAAGHGEDRPTANNDIELNGAAKTVDELNDVPVKVVNNSYNDYGNHLKTLNRPDLAAEFQTYRERWVADARLSLSGRPRSETWAINLIVEDCKWMLWRFDTLFEDAPAQVKGYAEPTAMESQSYLRSAIKLAESGELSGNLLGEKGGLQSCWHIRRPFGSRGGAIHRSI